MVKLKNLSRRMRSFNLELPTFVNSQGTNGVGKPETLTMLAHEIKEVPAEALQCREIRSALNPSKGRPTLRVLAS